MQRIRVCVADDYVDEASVLCEGLRLNGYEAIPTHNGQDTLNVCFEGGIDLLLLDIGLPDIDGHEVCRRLKDDPSTRDIPIIFVTARGQRPDVQQGYELGAVDYIPKPYNLPMVMVRVDSVVRTRQSLGAVRFGEENLLDTCYTDQLTGLRNRRYLLERLQEELDKASRYNYPVACVVVDLDETQAMDLEMGSASMDDLLAEIAMTMRHLSRSFDIVARYDTSLFAAVLPHAGLDDAVSYANKIREEASAMTFSDPPTHARLSFGVVACQKSGCYSAESVLGEAMHGLLQAKSHAESGMVARHLSHGVGAGSPPAS